tara:strand:- start:2553 stop:2756 length:204 start_codon:yes stop_codon:yes gene_type:complete
MFRQANSKEEKERAFTAFKDHPELLEVLGKMNRAQNGLKVRASARTLRRAGDELAKTEIASSSKGDD